MFWALFSVLAAATQTLRNALQRDLTARLGTIGATQVRFLFGFPFGLALMVVALVANGRSLPAMSGAYLLWTFGGAALQIIATALMLKAMTSKSFVVTTAYTKTEPVQVALFGLVFLGDHLTPLLVAAILIATAGVMLLGWPKSREAAADALGPALLGIAAGGCFALSAILFRGGIHRLDVPEVWVKASVTLAVGLGMQTAFFLVYMLLTDRATLGAILRSWKPSMVAGFAGALASQFWFLGFALTSAARVRTLGLVEVLFAYAVSGKVFKEKPQPRDLAGLALVVLGVALCLNA